MTAKNADEAQNDGADTDNIEYFALAHKVNLGVTHKILSKAEREVEFLLMVQHPVDNQTGDENAGEQRGNDTDTQRYGEALDGARAEHNQHQTQQEGSHLTVDDSRHSVLETFVDSVGQTLAGTQLFLDTLIDNHVAVDSHCHCQHNTCDTRQSQHSADRGKHTHQQEHVGHQSHNRNPTGAVVEDNHINKYYYKSKNE